MAIARHHSSLSSSYPDFRISNRNYAEMEKLLREINIDVDLQKEEIQGYLDGFETEWHGERVLYLFFARILRLCDQRATENLIKYFNE